MVWGHLGAQSLGVGIIYPFRWRFKGGGYHSVGRNSLTPSHASSMVSAGVGLSLSLYIYIYLSLSRSLPLSKRETESYERKTVRERLVSLGIKFLICPLLHPTHLLHV